MKLDKVREVGRHRTDLGNIRELADSIAAVGLLHPVVVTPDLDLVAGQRRLAAMRALGWTEGPVRIVDNLTDAAAVLRAEADENTCRKDFTPTEAETIASAREAILKPLAKERMSEGGKGVKVGHPSPRTDRASATGTGFSASTIRKVRETKALAADTATPEPVRQVVADALAEMDETGKVDAAYKKVKASITAADYIAKYPELAHYRDNGKRVADIGQRLDAYTPTERSTRLENLRKVIAAELRREAEPPEPAAPDYYAMTDAIFVVANRLAQVIDKEGGAATVAAAIPRADPVMSRTWHEQFASLATTLSALADATQPKLRSIR